MEDNFSDTAVKLKLGKVEYTVKFGIHARRRIEESCPGFNLLTDKMPDFEIIPFLITQGIPPLDRKWETENEFLDLYDACEDKDGLSKIPLAFQNALGFTNQLFLPAIRRIQQVVSEGQKESSTGETTTESPAE